MLRDGWHPRLGASIRYKLLAPARCRPAQTSTGETSWPTSESSSEAGASSTRSRSARRAPWLQGLRRGRARGHAAGHRPGRLLDRRRGVRGGDRRGRRRRSRRWRCRSRPRCATCWPRASRWSSPSSTAPGGGRHVPGSLRDARPPLRGARASPPAPSPWTRCSSKRQLAAAGVPVVEFEAVSRRRVRGRSRRLPARAASGCRLPLFVKPSVGGSQRRGAEGRRAATASRRPVRFALRSTTWCWWSAG